MARGTPTRLAIVPFGDGASHSIYVVGAGKRAIVTCIHCANTSSSDPQTVLAAITDGTDTFYICSGFSVAPDSYQDIEISPGFVMNSGDTLNFECGIAISASVFGYEEIV